MRQRAKPLGIIIGWPGQQVRSNRVRPPDELALTPGGIQPLFACQDCTFCRSVHRAGVCNFFHVEPARQGTKTVGLRPTVLVRCLMAGMAGRRSGRNGCFGAAAAGVLHGARTIPTVAGRSMRALSRLADVAGFWTLDRTTITGRSAVILRQHTTPFRPMIVPFDDLELVYQSLRTLEPPHTHKFPRVNAQGARTRNVGFRTTAGTFICRSSSSKCTRSKQSAIE